MSETTPKLPVNIPTIVRPADFYKNIQEPGTNKPRDFFESLREKPQKTPEIPRVPGLRNDPRRRVAWRGIL